MGWRRNIAVWARRLRFCAARAAIQTNMSIWVYENAGDREAKRAKLWSDPDWLAYVQKSAELGALERQKNKLMVPTSFCPDLTTG